MTKSKNRFFPRGLKPGDPLSREGFVDGILKMAAALDELSVHNGRIDWSNNIPKIIVERTPAADLADKAKALE